MRENTATICENLGWNQVNSENLSFYKAIGIDGVSILGLPVVTNSSEAIEDLKRIRDLVQSYGLKIYDIRWSVPDWNAVTNGLDNRDQQTELCCKAIRAIGSIGVPFCGYTFLSIGHFRTMPTTGRGGAKYSAFDYEEFKKSHSDHPRKTISKEELWENIEYFLRQVIPVAEEAGVRLALHPDDPPIDEPLGGAPRIVTSPENYQRIFDLVPSDYNAMLFCQGCFAEMGIDVMEAIRYFGSRRKICMVHFRNIRGNPYRFEETFIDEGNVDMFRAMQVYREIGFNGPFLVDHIPSIPQTLASRAYAVGYIRAMIQAAYR